MDLDWYVTSIKYVLQRHKILFDGVKYLVNPNRFDFLLLRKLSSDLILKINVRENRRVLKNQHSKKTQETLDTRHRKQWIQDTGNSGYKTQETVDTRHRKQWIQDT